MFFAALFLSVVSLALGADTACTNRNGHCQDDSTHCSGHYETGLCDGPTHRRCCIPPTAAPADDSECTSLKGHCLDDHTPCDGHYQTGLCSGGAHRRCCMPPPQNCPHIISREEWGAVDPHQPLSNMAGPAQYVFLHHGGGAFCHDQASCERVIRGWQHFHMAPEPDGRGWNDIAYNFIVGEDGNAYMGRGWTAVGGHTRGYNSVGIAICVPGDFTHRAPNSAALNKVKQLIQCGLEMGHIKSSYTLKGHRDVGTTECPGDTYYNLIQSWPHYVSGTALYTGR